MSIIKEFKDFALKGNVVDMAVGIIIGGAFLPIVQSLVKDILMPPLGLLLGDLEFSEYKLTIKEASAPGVTPIVEAVTINHGNFINILISFLIVAGAVFMMIKALNSLKRKEEEVPGDPDSKDCPQCFMAVPFAAHKCGHCTSAI